MTFVAVLLLKHHYSRLVTQLMLLSALLLGMATVCIAQPDDDNLDQNISNNEQILEQAHRAISDAERERLAVDYIKKSTRGARRESGIIEANLILGEVYARTGRVEKALSVYLEAENKCDSSRAPRYLHLVHTGLGNLFYEQQLYLTAIDFYKKVLAVHPRDYVVMEKMADCYLYSILQTQEKQNLFSQNSNSPSITNGALDIDFVDPETDPTLQRKAAQDLDKMRFDTAEFLYKILIAKYKEDDDNAHLIQIYQKIANAYEQQGNVGKQLLYYIRIENIVSQHGTPQSKGRLYNNLGKVYAAQGKYEMALDNFRKSEQECALAAKKPNKRCENEELLYINMGVVLHNTGRTREGLTYLFMAVSILKERNDQIALASLEHLIATVYFSINDRYNALQHTERSIQYAKATNEIEVLSRAYRTASRIYQDLYDYEKAFEYYKNYLELSDKIRLDQQRREVMLTERSGQLRNAKNEINLLLAQREIKEREYEQSKLRQAQLEKDNQILAANATEQELKVRLIQSEHERDSAALRAQIALAMEADEKLRRQARELELQKKDAEYGKMQQQNTIIEAQNRENEQRVALLNREKELSDLQLLANEEFQRNTYVLGTLGTLVLLLMGISWWYARRTGKRLRMQNQKIEAQKNQIESERSKSDRLLRNILPDEIAEELKTRGHAMPKLYDSATVLFTDFVNFTKLSATLQPERIISELDECFLAFDEIIEKYGLEKIKTIGDAFMCAGGLPIPNNTHAVDAVFAAIEINEWLQRRNLENANSIFREMRIGIHTGPVVAGVIGKNKFAYDIWGDAVNLASRLEEQGESGKINISQATYEAIKHRFKCTWRGQREVHNKGIIDMYFVDGELT